MASPIVCMGCGGVVLDAAAAPPGDGDEVVLYCVCPPPTRRLTAQEAASLQCSSCGASVHDDERGCDHCRPTVAARRCFSCLAWNFAEARRCSACREAFADGPERDDALMERHRCPRCPGTLLRRSYVELVVEECDACGGMLLSPPMVERAIQPHDSPTAFHLALPRRPYTRDAGVNEVACPVCKAPMARRVFARISGVVVDVCAAHGVWFDPGELGEVIAFVERGGLEALRRRTAAQGGAPGRPGPRDPAPVAVAPHATDVAAAAKGAQPLFAEVLASLWR